MLKYLTTVFLFFLLVGVGFATPSPPPTATPTPSVTPTPTPSPTPVMVPHWGNILGTQAAYGRSTDGVYRPLLVDSNGYLLTSGGQASSVPGGLEFTLQTTLPATNYTLAVSTTGVLWYTGTGIPIQVVP